MTQNKKILLVEDDPDMREMISAFLSSGPYDIALAGSVPAALKRLSQEGPFDLAVLDFWLGRENSISILDMIRSNNQDTPVIVISGGHHRMDLEATAAISEISGAVVFLQKPFQKSTLLDAVATALAP